MPVTFTTITPDLWDILDWMDTDLADPPSLASEDPTEFSLSSLEDRGFLT